MLLAKGIIEDCMLSRQQGQTQHTFAHERFLKPPKSLGEHVLGVAFQQELAGIYTPPMSEILQALLSNS